MNQPIIVTLGGQDPDDDPLLSVSFIDVNTKRKRKKRGDKKEKRKEKSGHTLMFVGVCDTITKWPTYST